MNFCTTTTFRKDLESLCSRPKFGYSSCKKDISSEFKRAKTFQEIWNKPTSILDKGNIRIIKSRIPNSGQNTGKSGGFRIIFLANKKTNEVCLLHIYPKTGKYGKENILDKELERLLTEYFNEKTNKILQKIDINEKTLKIERKAK